MPALSRKNHETRTEQPRFGLYGCSHPLKKRKGWGSLSRDMRKSGPACHPSTLAWKEFIQREVDGQVRTANDSHSQRTLP